MTRRFEAMLASPIASLAIACVIQGVATQFMMHVVPSFMRKAGHSPQVIGLIFLAYIPYVLRFAWAPLVDRYGSARLGHRRSWILPAQIGVCICASLYFWADPAQGAWPVIAVSALLIIAVATQAVATGGFMVEALAPEQRAAGTSVQAASAGIAGLVVGGGVLALFGDRGWAPTTLAFVALTLAGLVGLALVRLDRGRPPSGAAASPFASFAMFKRPEIRRLLALLLFIEVGLVLPYGMKPVLQVDAGLSMATIGLIGVIGGNLAGIAGAVLAKPLVDRLGPWRVVAVILALTVVMDVALAAVLVTPTPVAVISFVLASSLLSFGYFTASRTLILGVCDPRQGATELSTLLCLGNAFVLALASFGNLIAGRIGTQFLFVVAAAFAAAAFVAVLRTSKARSEANS